MSSSAALNSSARCIRSSSTRPVALLRFRHFTSTGSTHEEAVVEQVQARPEIIPRYIGTKQEERILKKHGLSPVGSRRRRAAIRDSSNIPFEQLPYQCFQEARKVLAEDREEKIRKIEEERRRIAEVESKDASELGGEHVKKGKLVLMNKYLSQLKVLADVNDPMIKKRFEDGLGDMDRPIYRHLADKKWRSYKRLILEQRIDQMFVVPDVLAKIDLTADVSVHFGRKAIPPGEFVDSKISEVPPTLDVQVFDRGPRLVTIAVVDADVPNVEKDDFDHRCHFLATNIELSPTQSTIKLGELPAENTAYPWMPPHAQKGSPYHRLAIIVLQQAESHALDLNIVQEKYKRLGFSMRHFSGRNKLKPISATLFRTIWDDNMAAVMERAGIEGADVELKRKKPEALPWQYKVKDGERYR